MEDWTRMLGIHWKQRCLSQLSVYCTVKTQHLSLLEHEAHIDDETDMNPKLFQPTSKQGENTSHKAAYLTVAKTDVLVHFKLKVITS